MITDRDNVFITDEAKGESRTGYVAVRQLPDGTLEIDHNLTRLVNGDDPNAVLIKSRFGAPKTIDAISIEPIPTEEHMASRGAKLLAFFGAMAGLLQLHHVDSPAAKPVRDTTPQNDHSALRRALYMTMRTGGGMCERFGDSAYRKKLTRKNKVRRMRQCA